MNSHVLLSQLTVGEFTPETVSNRLFSIPVYQRLYAWKEKQITDLLQDLRLHDGVAPYYLGNITLNVASAPDALYELIDGQQRITTLFLLATVLKDYYPRWSSFLHWDHSIRLSFPSRKMDMDYLKSLADGVERDADTVNRRLPAAIRVIKDFVDKTFDSLSSKQVFAERIYMQLKLVYVVLPAGTDMNWYFEILNSRGEQLEKHEILKARILDRLSEKRRFSYSKIWDACSQMDSYLEDTVNKEVATKIARYDGTDSALNEIIQCFDSIGFAGEAELHTLSEIMEAGKTYEYKELQVSAPKVSSIISFTELLLITHSVIVHKIPDNFSEKNLLGIVQFVHTEEYEEFIPCLLKMRLLFDHYIIKNIVVENRTRWEVACFQVTADQVGEPLPTSITGLLIHLQAMLFVSSTQQEYWLVPFLHYLDRQAILLYRRTVAEIAAHLTIYLEELDTLFARSRILQLTTLRAAAEELIGQDFEKRSNSTVSLDLLLHKGTSTERYWFFRLDYLLIKEWKTNGLPKKHAINRQLVEKFQFRQSRSVEHVYPQNPEEGYDEWDKSQLDLFGNLALISNSTNSSYNHYQPSYKKRLFEGHNEKWGLESLKLLEIYSYENWNEESVITHQEEMIALLKNSFK